MKALWPLMLCLLVTGPGSGYAQNSPLRIGVLTDFSGPLASYYGSGSPEAVRMAVEDFGGEVLGRKLEVIQADHLSKPDIAMNIVRDWFDQQGVEVVVDLGNSGVALAIRELGMSKNKTLLFTGPAVELSGERCSANGVHWTHDVFMLTSAVTNSLLKQGVDTWFLLSANYVMGQQMRDAVANIVTTNGGRVLGSATHPFNTSDFSSFLLQAQGSKAKAIGFMNSVGDLANSLKQAEEFKIGASQRLVAFALTDTDVRGIGLETAKGLSSATVFYWDRDDESRAFARRFFARAGTMPTGVHAANWSAVTHYLKAAAAAKTVDSATVVRKMKEIPVDDFYAGKTFVRRDGRLMNDVYLIQAKSPSESTGKWDVLKVLRTVARNDAWRSLPDHVCSAK